MPGKPARLLLTGFEPFGGDRTNTSWQIARAIATRGLPGFEVSALVLPVEFERAGARLLAVLADSSPDAVVCLGLALGRDAVTPERVALNLRGGNQGADDPDRPDNAGAMPRDTPIDPAGPYAYPTALPVHAFIGSARAAGAPAAVSYSAGTYVCNDVFYQLMRYRELTGDRRPGGFVHVPRATEHLMSPDERTVAFETLVAGVSAGLGALAG
jgi:pyroglutamyl-peptidase